MLGGTVSSRKSTSRKAAVPSTTRVAPASRTLRHRVVVAQAAADLDRHPDLGDDPAHVLEVGRLAAAGAVEVDHVQRAGARLTQRRAASSGSASYIGALVEVSARQPHRLAVEDVDRGQEDHARSA